MCKIYGNLSLKKYKPIKTTFKWIFVIFIKWIENNKYKQALNVVFINLSNKKHFNLK